MTRRRYSFEEGINGSDGHVDGSRRGRQLRWKRGRGDMDCERPETLTLEVSLCWNTEREEMEALMYEEAVQGLVPPHVLQRTSRTRNGCSGCSLVIECREVRDFGGVGW